MIHYTVPVEIDAQGNGKRELPEPVDNPQELKIDGHAREAVVKIEDGYIVITGAPPWSYFNVSYYVIQEHDVLGEPTDEPQPQRVE